MLELANLTEIETENDYMFKVLAQLLKAKILLCTNRTISDDTLVNQEDTLISNNKYKRLVESSFPPHPNFISRTK